MPQDRADFLRGQQCAVLANIHRTKDGPIFKATDFLPMLPEEQIEEEEPAAAPEMQLTDLKATAEALEAMLGRKK